MKQWLAHTTVAAVIQKDDQFLLVKENPGGQGEVFNQPAGHLEDNESLIDALVRETLEETGHLVRPEYLIGIYQWKAPDGTSFIRYCYACALIFFDEQAEIDPDIIDVCWVNGEDILQQNIVTRSPLVKQCVADFIEGHCYPLELIQHIQKKQSR